MMASICSAGSPGAANGTPSVFMSKQRRSKRTQTALEIHFGGINRRELKLERLESLFARFHLRSALIAI